MTTDIASCWLKFMEHNKGEWGLNSKMHLIRRKKLVLSFLISYVCPRQPPFHISTYIFHHHRNCKQSINKDYLYLYTTCIIALLPYNLHNYCPAAWPTLTEASAHKQCFLPAIFPHLSFLSSAFLIMGPIYCRKVICGSFVFTLGFLSYGNVLELYVNFPRSNHLMKITLEKYILF